MFSVFNANKNDNNTFVFRSIFIIFLVVLCISVIRLSFNSDIVTFKGFLEFLSSCPMISIPLDFTDYFNISSSWGVFDFLRNFINFFSTPFSFIIFLVTNIINVLIFVFWFLKFIF